MWLPLVSGCRGRECWVQARALLTLHTFPHNSRSNSQQQVHCVQSSVYQIITTVAVHLHHASTAFARLCKSFTNIKTPACTHSNTQPLLKVLFPSHHSQYSIYVLASTSYEATRSHTLLQCQTSSNPKTAIRMPPTLNTKTTKVT